MRTSFFNIKNRLGNYTDTIWNDTNILGIVETYVELQDDKYLLQVLLNEPDSNTYNFSFLTTGIGRFDFWSTSLLGTSHIVQSGLPSATTYPPIVHYTFPDSAKTTVSSFSCLPSILTVANFENRKTYLDVDSIIRLNSEEPGARANSSSLGPDRRGNLKPDIAATGNFTLGPNSAAVIAANLASTPANRAKVAYGGMHRLNGGTSMASPVVAGIAALYLEKCPNATMAEIKNAIISSAKQDTFTNVVPNPAFGHGKVNAFDALNTSNFSYLLGGNKDVCDGDSVEVNASGFSGYLWSTSDTSSSSYIDTTEQVFVKLTNSSGCVGFSDTITVKWHPLPTKPNITLLGDDSLLYSSSLNMQWYFNNNSLLGENDTLHIAQNDGDYFVQVTDSFGCQNTSDTLSIVLQAVEDNIKNIANIFPNPSTRDITIIFNSLNVIKSFSLMDVSGKVIHTESMNSELLEYKLDLESLTKGIYYLRFYSDEKHFVQKIVLINSLY